MDFKVKSKKDSLIFRNFAYEFENKKTREAFIAPKSWLKTKLSTMFESKYSIYKQFLTSILFSIHLIIFKNFDLSF